MSRARQSIIGFTEAELGFFLTCVLLLFVLVGAVRLSKVPQSVPKTQFDSLKAVADSLRTELEKSKKQRLGVPSCTEMKVANGALATLTVLDRANYAVDSVRLSIAQVPQHFANELADARAHGCRHSVRVAPGEGVLGDDYVAAVKALEGTFYTPLSRRASR